MSFNIDNSKKQKEEENQRETKNANLCTKSTALLHLLPAWFYCMGVQNITAVLVLYIRSLCRCKKKTIGFYLAPSYIPLLLQKPIDWF